MKKFCIFVERNLLYRIVKSIQIFYTNKKGIVPNSKSSNTISEFRNIGGLYPIYYLLTYNYNSMRNSNLKKVKLIAIDEDFTHFTETSKEDILEFIFTLTTSKLSEPNLTLKFKREVTYMGGLLFNLLNKLD